MLFETRECVAEVSPQWVDARDTFLQGRSGEAWKIASDLRAKRAMPQSANDYILCMEIARACLATKTYLAISRIAVQAFPTHPICQLYHARSLLTRGLHKDALKYLHDQESNLGLTNPGWWATALANTYADAGFTQSCDQWLKRAASSDEFDSPLGLYTRASSMASLQRWDSAIELSRRCVDVAPRWSRARALLVHCLLTRGEVDQAVSNLKTANNSDDQDASLNLTGGFLAFSLGDFSLARDRLESFLGDWPQANHRDWARRCLAILLVENGDHQSAREVVGDDAKKLSLPEIPPTAGGGAHKFIPVPVLAQNKDQCVPTTVAIAAYPQGNSLDPDQLFREMKGRDGTALWRAWDWVDANGFQPRAVLPTKEAAIAMIDAGIPLIGTIYGAFHSHVEVIVGYNEDLNVAYVRDPAFWAPLAWPWDLLLRRYELNNGLLAVIDRSNREAVATAEQFNAPDYVAIIDLGRAVAEGDTAAAEEATGRINDDSSASYLRDVSGVRVTISTKQFHDKLKHWALDTEANPVVRFRSLMNLGSEDAKRMLEDWNDENDQAHADQRASLGPGAKRFLRLITSMDDGDWKQADALIERLLRRGCGVSAFWEIKSDIESELGNSPACLDALSNAIELEPLRMTLREKWLQRNIHTLTFNEYLDEFDQLLADDRDAKYLLLGRAVALLDGPDGKAYEAAAKECLHWFPRDPTTYGQLMQWYESQVRPDLQQATLAKARKWMPDIFDEDAPSDNANHDRANANAANSNQANRHKADDDKAAGDKPADDKAAGDKPADDKAADDDKELTADSPLPSDKEELLALVSKVTDPRRDRAVAEALKMAAEHRLNWFEHSRLVAFRVLLPENGPDGKPAVTPEQCLPLEFSGAPHWFAHSVADTVTEFNSVIEIAQAVLNWMDRLVPDYESYPSVWFQRVLLLENSREKELALVELSKMIERYPAHASALYRMAVVKYQQNDYRSSLHYADQSLQVNPGLTGSLQLKLQLLEVLDMPDQRSEAMVLMRQKVPYDFDWLRDQMLANARTNPLDKVISDVRQCADEFPPDRITLLLARLHLDAGDVAQAQNCLQGIDAEKADDTVFEDHLQLAFALAEANQNAAETARLCDVGLQRWPDSTRLKEIKAECIAETNPQEAASLLRQTIVDGEPSASTVWQYLNLVNTSPDATCISLVNSVDESKREDVIEMCDDVLSHPSLLQFRKAFLTKMLKKHQDADFLRWRLAGHLHLIGDVKSALKYANELHERMPGEPESARMLGRIMIDKDPKRALPLLEAACKKNRSVDYLFDLARCHQLAGNASESKTLHWEVLDQNPFVAASWTNLYVFGESHHKLWPMVEPMLCNGRCNEDEYFLVATVKIAVAMNKTLPTEWFPLAVTRNQMLETHAGFQGEKKELRNAIAAWLTARPQDRNGHTHLPRKTLRDVFARFLWPGTKWIPAT